jgi:RHS repeat-associated protein
VETWCLGPEAYASVPLESLLNDVTSTFNRVDWLRRLEDAKDATRTVVLGYDLAGNLVEKQTQGGTRTLAWDIRNTLTAVRDNGLEVGRYDYDARLQRTRRQTASENVAYVLDDGFVLQEADGAQASRPTKRRYHYGKGPLAVSNVGSNSTTTNFLGTDVLGSVADAMSTGGRLVAARQYDAWGNHRNDSAPGAGTFKLGFTGHQFDVETGLTYARARYYDSELGRFISRDSYEGTLADAPSLHRYRYARANPLRWVDPSGYRDATPTELQEMSRWEDTLASAEKRFNELSTAMQFVQWLPPKRSSALAIDVLRQNLASRRAAIARAADGMSVDPGTYEVGESIFSAPDGTQFTVKTFPMWMTGVEAYVQGKASVGQALTSPFGTAAYGITTALGASEEKVDAAIIAAAQGGEFIGPNGLKGKAFARPPGKSSKGTTPRVRNGKDAPGTDAAAKPAKDGTAEKAGGGGFKLALGFSKHPDHKAEGLVGKFAKHVGAKTYWDFYADDTNDPMVLGSRLLRLMHDADQIHFNLDGLVRGKTTVRDIYDAGSDGIGRYNITNWEFYQTMSRHRDKATIYLEGRERNLLELDFDK